MTSDISRGIDTQELKAHIILSGQRARAEAGRESPDLGETQGTISTPFETYHNLSVAQPYSTSVFFSTHQTP